MKTAFKSALIFLSAAIMGAGLAAAESLVLASTDEAITPGEIISDGEEIVVVEGAHIVLLLENGEEHRLVGPTRFIEGGQTAGGADAGTLLEHVAEILSRFENEQRLGGVRSDPACSLPSEAIPWVAIASAWTGGCQIEAVDAASKRLEHLQDAGGVATAALQSPDL